MPKNCYPTNPGISNTIGRLLGGALSNQKRVDLMHLYCGSLVMAGALTFTAVTWATTVVHVSWYFSFLGLSTGYIASLIPAMP